MNMKGLKEWARSKEEFPGWFNEKDADPSGDTDYLWWLFILGLLIIIGHGIILVGGS